MDGRLYDLLILLVEERTETVAPLSVNILLEQTCDGGQRNLAVAHHSHSGLHVLVYLRAVYVEVDDLGLFGIGVQAASHTVAETHADGNEHIALLFLHVGSITAVHAEHAHIERMV